MMVLKVTLWVALFIGWEVGRSSVIGNSRAWECMMTVCFGETNLLPFSWKLGKIMVGRGEPV